MGYTTTFDGFVSVRPKLNEEEIQRLKDFSKERHGGNIDNYSGFPGLYCQWVPSQDGTEIIWDGNEKFYDSVEWMQYIIDKMFPTHKFSGVIYAQGEETGDVWDLIVKNNVASVKKVKRTKQRK